VDCNGNVLVTGDSAHSRNSPTDYDYITIKYSSAGVPIWTNRYDGGSADDDYPAAIAVDGAGNSYIAGTAVDAGGTSVYATIKYSSNGAPSWTNVYAAPDSFGSVAMGIAVDKATNVYVTGYSFNSDLSRPTVTIKYTSAGIPVWTNRYMGPGLICEATAIAVDSVGNAFVSGSSEAGGSFPTNGSDYAIIKYPAVANSQLPVILTDDGAFGISNGVFGFSISGPSGSAVVVDFCTNFAQPNWSALQTNNLGGSPVHFSDPESTNFGSRFYRLRSKQN
jgi:hypothetical protein